MNELVERMEKDENEERTLMKLKALSTENAATKHTADMEPRVDRMEKLEKRLQWE
eukprot:CAMPEP_0197744670 /NCGR_PEP_ID=MMETSP1435-20131217/39629_1 /TAXON_ID=426625 /ORGANISM="Chaetoceros brevis, Strain CCMP164" /LENGTH=54 /DNA_ID=CAMNT_0043336139 /DNA_START=288 /DNA_END=452 /DNA_ORIENTATION=-